MNPFRSVGALLSIALSLVVVGALLIVYFMVVPSLQHRLINSKLDQLSSVAPALKRKFDQVESTPDTTVLTDFADTAQSSANADRVAVLNGDLFTIRADTKVFSTPLVSDPVAVRAYQSGSIAQGTAIHDGKRFAEVGYVYPKPLIDVEGRPSAVARLHGQQPVDRATHAGVLFHGIGAARPGSPSAARRGQCGASAKARMAAMETRMRDRAT